MTRREALQKLINRNQMIVNGLENNTAWEEVVKDLGAERRRLDDNWQFIEQGDKKWYEFRITKLAIMKIINLVNDYKHDMQEAKKEIGKIDNPDKKIRKDVDTE